MRTLITWVLAAIVVSIMIAVGVQLAYADDLVAAPSPPILVEMWTIVQPVVALFVSIVGPALATWVAVHLVSFLQIKDANEKKALEAKVRDALHQAALNGLKFAAAKAQVTLAAGAPMPTTILTDAIGYVRSKSPDTAKEAGVSDRDLEQIILSKVPDVLATISAAKPLGV